MLIFQPRVGGPATAALIADAMWGLVGFSACLFRACCHGAAGAWAGLALALGVWVIFNIMLYGFAAARWRAARGSGRRCSSLDPDIRFLHHLDHLLISAWINFSDSSGELTAAGTSAAP